jgi:predicted RNA-binding protein Jag
MKEFEVLAKSQQEAIEKGAALAGVAAAHLEVVEEYEPDEQDLALYQQQMGLDKPPSAEEVTLYVLRVGFGHYLEMAQTWVQGLIERFAPGSTAEAVRLRNTIIVRLNVPESSILIGRKGATLDALQHIVLRVLLSKDDKFPDLMLDVEGYREKKLIRLEKEAMRAAEKARRTGRRVPLTPMSAAERKFIHKVLKDVEGVRTESRGEDYKRHIVVEPTDPRAARGRGGAKPGRGQTSGKPAQRAKGGPITEEQRQLLYGKKMSESEDEEEDDDAFGAFNERPSLLPGFEDDDEDLEDEDGEDFEDEDADDAEKTDNRP